MHDLTHQLFTTSCGSMALYSDGQSLQQPRAFLQTGLHSESVKDLSHSQAPSQQKGFNWSGVWLGNFFFHPQNSNNSQGQEL